jgi:hypothetical protein
LREHWREVDYWRWLWHWRVPFQAKVGLGVVLTVLLMGGGWFAADRLTAAHAGTASTDAFVLETTVQKVVVVHERGKVVRKLVPVVTRVRLPGKTTFETRTSYKTQVVTTPGTVQVIHRLVTKYVPVVKKRVVTVNGKTHTVVQTRLVPTTRTETQTQTQTREVTNQQTVTNTQNNTQTVTQTKTTTLPAVTVTQTQTQTQTETVTKTVTETDTVTVTDTQTVTQTVTDTITETITETITVPPGK